MDADMHGGRDDELHIVQVSADQRCWKDAMAGIELIIEEILGKVL